MEERHLSLSEAADALDISERTAYRWIKSGKLRAFKPGRDYWIPESATREVIEGSRVRPKAQRRSSLEPSFNDVFEEERHRDYEAALAVLYRGLARRARRIVERSRREGPSPELGEEAAAWQAEESAVARIRGRSDIHGNASAELAEAEDAYQEQSAIIQKMIRQDVQASPEEREEAQRFRPRAQASTERGSDSEAVR